MAKKPKTGLLSFLSNRNNILILLIIVVIIAVALLIMGSEEETRALDIEDVNRNPDKYINKTISVIGYFESSDNTISTNPDPQDVTNPALEILQLDLTGVTVNNTSLIDDAEYIFTGKLIWDPHPFSEQTKDVVLQVEKYKRHR